MELHPVFCYYPFMNNYKIPSWVLALFACLLWSTAFVGVKYAISFAPPLFVAGMRFILAGVILIPFAGIYGYYREVKAHIKVIALVALLQTFAVYVLYFLALDRIKASTGAALVGVGPLMGAIMGHLHIKGDRFTKKKIISFALGLVGVTLVSLGGGHDGNLPNSSELLGIILFILSSFTGAVSNVVVVKYKSDIKPTVLTSSQLILGGIALFTLSFIVYDDISFILPLKFYLSLGWLVFVSAVGFSIWFYLLSKRKESLISMNIWKFIMPVSGGVLGWIIMPNDSPNVSSIIGMIVVASSILFFYSRNLDN